MERKFFELLAPAGDYEIFKSVIESGADAVYVGGSMFGARAYANNFTEEELLEAIDYAHLRKKHVYLTVNTLVKNDELEKLYYYLLPYYKRGLDAVIVQDIGAVKLIHDFFPDLPIHTSTQMTVTGVEGVRFLQKYGVTRVVMAREVSLEEMKYIHEQTGMELEAFVHGALCYSYSGQCLFSSILGGRSGNRGRCAQPCRLPYSLSDKNMYILSLKDMCGLKALKELRSAGIYSLKIEGRMKQVNYACGVVSMYRKYIDSMEQVTEKDYKLLEGYGNRCGFTDKYYFEHNSKDMVTYKKPSFESVEKYAQNESQKLKIKGTLRLEKDLPGSLMVQMDGYEYTALIDEISEARNAPLTADLAVERIKKTGDTPYEFSEINTEIGENIFVPNGMLNKLRREALNGLSNAVLRKYNRDNEKEYTDKKTKHDKYDVKIVKRCICSCMTKPQLKELKKYDIFTDYYIDINMYEREAVSQEFLIDVRELNELGKKTFLVLPTIFRKDTAQWFYKQVDDLKKIDFEGFVVKNYEELYAIKELFENKKIVLDHNMYTYNDIAKDTLHENGADYDTVPLELNYNEIKYRDNKKSDMIIYGYYPLMTSAQCIHKNTKGCDKKLQIEYIKDRYNKKFAVLNNCRECYNTIFNSLPTSLISVQDKLMKCGIESFRYSFTIESVSQIRKVLEGDLAEYTNGHFKRGVE